MTEKIADFLINLPSEVVIIVLAMLPVVELRGAIPWGIFALKMDWYYVYILSVIGNLLPVPFILFLLEPAQNLLNRWKFANRFFTWLFNRTRRRGGIIEKYRALGLILFVSVPLPITGAWTGSVAAHIFGIPRQKAFLSIMLGVMIAGFVVSTLCILGIAFTGLVT